MDITFYEDTIDLVVSQNCIDAAQDYFDFIELNLSDGKLIDADIVRVAIRPVFYLGILDMKNMINYVNNHIYNCPLAKHFLANNLSLVDKAVKILESCCDYYNIRYDSINNCVLLTRRNNESFVFKKFEEFKEVITRDFGKFDLSDKELERIIKEEKFIDVFNQIN